MPLTSKQRAQLRALSNDFDPVVYIGKEGITPNLSKQAWDALEARLRAGFPALCALLGRVRAERIPELARR